MSPLLELSNELLYKIIDHIHPDDIVNFSLCRKEVYLLAKDAVSLHLQRKRIYENVALHGCHRHERNAHPLWLIRDMCMDWRIGEYTKFLTFQCCHHPNRPDDAIEDEDEEDTKQFEVEKREDDVICQTTMQAIQGYIEEKFIKSGYSNLDRTDEGGFNSHNEWYLSRFNERESCSAAKEGNRDAMLGLLLFFMPNLKAICLAQSTWGTRFLEEAINWICFKDQTPQWSHRARKPLINLSQVRFLGYGGEDMLYADDTGEDFEGFMPFAALPSMRTLLGDFVEGRDKAEGEWWFPPRTSNVTEIILRHSAVKPEYLAELMPGIKALKRFIYHYNENLYRGGAMEIHKIIGILLEHTKHSLEYLGITGDWCLRVGNRGIHPCKGSLRDFEVLKEVVLDSYVFVEPASYLDPGYNPNDITYNESHGHTVRHLVDELPPSIETIHLVGAEVLKHAGGLLFNLFDQKELRLPKLRKLIIETGRNRPGGGWERALRERCEKVGVTLAM